MLRLFRLLFSAPAEWERTSLNPPHPLVVLLVSLVPLMIVTLGVEYLGLMRWGEAHGELGSVRLPQERVLKYVIFYALASVVVLLVGTVLLNNVATSFNLRGTFGKYFILMTLGYAPLFLARMLDALPQINTWLCWAIGAMLGMRVLYHGVALWLQPEQTKGLGVFLVTLIYTLVLSGLVHFASIQVLHGRLLKDVRLGDGAPVQAVPAAADESAVKPAQAE
jgi:hypothetical protein